MEQWNKGKRRGYDHWRFTHLEAVYGRRCQDDLAGIFSTGHRNFTVDGLHDFPEYMGFVKAAFGTGIQFCIIRSMQSVAKYRRVKLLNICATGSKGECTISIQCLFDSMDKPLNMQRT